MGLAKDTDFIKQRDVEIQDLVYKLLSYFGLACYLFKIQLTSSKNLPLLFILINIPLQSWRFLQLGDEFKHPCWWADSDTQSYLAQGREFWRGNTNYTEINGIQGPCFYPAGNLWLYALIDKFIFRSFDHCETIFKFYNILLQSASLGMIISLARRYFGSEPSRVQVLGFLIISNHGINELYQLMYNENFLEFFMLCTIFCVAVLNRPILGSLILSFGISVKVPAILILPGLLGWIQYKNGTLTLLACLTAIIAVQVFIAAPFILDSAAVLMGWPGAKSTPYMYLVRAKIIPSQLKSRRYGAWFVHTQLFNFITEDLYHKGAFLDFL